jgi:hypothetical protein
MVEDNLDVDVEVDVVKGDPVKDVMKGDQIMTRNKGEIDKMTRSNM